MTADDLVTLIKQLPKKFEGLSDTEKNDIKAGVQEALKIGGQAIEQSLAIPQLFRRKYPEGVVAFEKDRLTAKYWTDWQAALGAKKLKPIGPLKGDTLVTGTPTGLVVKSVKDAKTMRSLVITFRDGSSVNVDVA